MEALTKLAYFVVGSGILAIAILVRSLLTSLLSRDIEQFKAELRVAHDPEIERLRAA